MSDGARTGRPKTPTTIDHKFRNFSPPSPQELAARVPNLEVTEILGQGGMGVVYKGRQPFLDRPVAIKLIRPDFDNEAAQQSFIQEARSLAKLAIPTSSTSSTAAKRAICFIL